MKNYFLSFEYRGPGYDRYISGVFTADLKTVNLTDFCRSLIRDLDTDGRVSNADANAAIIKVLSFNNVD